MTCPACHEAELRQCEAEFHGVPYVGFECSECGERWMTGSSAIEVERKLKRQKVTP